MQKQGQLAAQPENGGRILFIIEADTASQSLTSKYPGCARFFRHARQIFAGILVAKKFNEAWWKRRMQTAC